MPLDFKPSDVEEMRRVYRTVGELLLRMQRERPVEAAIAAFGLAHLIRELLDKYPDAARASLMEQVVVPFLNHEPFEGLIKIVH